MRNCARQPLSLGDMFETSCDPGLYPLASLSLAFPPHSLLAPSHPFHPPRSPATLGQLANGNLHSADDVVLPRGTAPSSDWTGHFSSGNSEWMGRASTTTTPQSDAEEEILRFRPNRMIDYTGASMAAMAGESSMKWGGKAGDAQSGRSMRSMINDALTRHSRITPLGASRIVPIERDDKGSVYPH